MTVGAQELDVLGVIGPAHPARDDVVAVQPRSHLPTLLTGLVQMTPILTIHELWLCSQRPSGSTRHPSVAFATPSFDQRVIVATLGTFVVA
jgi:hypothetical protein